MEATKKLLKRLPKKYHERIARIEAEDGLIDDCKYMLYFTNGYAWDGYPSLPVKSITEAIQFIKDSNFDEVEYEHFVKGDRF